MIEILTNTQFDFVSKFKITTIISTVMVLIGIFLTFTQMDYGVDFRGGAEIQAKFNQTVDLGKLRDTLGGAGFKDATVQSIGGEGSNEYLIKVQATEQNLNEVTDQINATMAKSFGADGVIIEKVDIVGPKAGEQLRFSAIQAMAWALFAILIYVGLRFDFKYAPGAIIALFHDVIIVTGVFALVHYEFSLQIVAALLAVIGYSVNDTVIVYDRVREHEAKYPERKLSEHINNATNDTMSRTVLTSGTTLFVSMVMYFFGGESIRPFFLTFSLGVIVGTYSSIFVASSVTLLLEKTKK